MSERIRKPALAPPPIRPATPRYPDPSAFLAAHYGKVWEERMRDLSFVNDKLAVEAIGFTRLSGDWVGVVVTPWFVNLFLIYGGGTLWGDIPAGERRYVNLPCGTLQFIADDDPDIGPYQYCPLIAPVDHLTDMASARKAALDAMQAVVTVPPKDDAEEAAAAPAPVTASVEAEKGPVSRRAFFRRLAGKR